ncbi:dirigent protein 22-like [Ziziphus jujuba]|uniref:Dirigent protein n=1 Tax=Ziziphus jujuba TaxID=326968 RepID=A0A6P3ZQW9_ZIZJJ|nr:dirigent protein 22-like [Ziziphus jujuba]
MPRKFLLLLLVVLLACSIADSRKPKHTHIQFYMHDIVSGPNATAIPVARRLSNYTGSDPIATMFGTVSVIDNPLTTTPDLNSTLIGRAQGIYATASQHVEYSLLMTLTVGFTSGPYNGSTLSVVGRNPVMSEVREMPIVGGTGFFRLAHGYCFARTYSMDQMDAVIGYNVTVVQY